MAEIRSLIAELAVSETVKEKALAVYQSIAEAESRVHGAEVDQIHFHEVGSMDAVADVTAVCLLMELLGAGAGHRFTDPCRQRDRTVRAWQTAGSGACHSFDS